jgi:signal peptidase I
MSPVVLAENEFFVLGDNHAVSLDSRQWGPVPRRLLVGKPISGR